MLQATGSNYTCYVLSYQTGFYCVKIKYGAMSEKNY